ncbi:MAG TPA: exonuclease SbcCD subunit D [Dehalococcoidia bacterium]|jgi:exonuclease SbcD|nr:exonuclease SbcCD subunit D [Dehalococcoidia bacterium]
MKIIHFSDLHLGIESYGRINPDTGLPTRLEDFLSALDQVVDYALENKVDLVLFCGDAYKTREPTPTQQREFAKRINRLSSNGIPIFLLVGNHDLPNAIGRATTTEIFDTLAVRNVYVSNRPDVYRIPTRGGTIQIASLPWPRRSTLLTREESKNLNLDQLKERLEQALTRAIERNAAKLDSSLPAILAAHVWVADARVGSESLMSIGQEHRLLRSVIANPAFDYIALGHIHKHQVLSNSPPVVYAGSLSRVDFSDEEDEKGFYLVEIEPEGTTGKRQVSFDFHPVSGRRFLTINVAISEQDIDPTATVLEAIAQREDEVKDAIVRLNITLPAPLEGQLRDADIREALREASYPIVVREVQRETRLRLGDLAAEEITPLKALEKYLEQKQVSPERAKVLMEYGEKLIQGER